VTCTFFLYIIGIEIYHSAKQILFVCRHYYVAAISSFIISRALQISKLGVDGHKLTSIPLNGVKWSEIQFCHSTSSFIYPPQVWGSHVYKLNQRQKLHATWWKSYIILWVSKNKSCSISTRVQVTHDRIGPTSFPSLSLVVDRGCGLRARFHKPQSNILTSQN
jgi:hypothetical protein